MSRIPVLLLVAFASACSQTAGRADYSEAFAECSVRGLYSELSSHNDTVTASSGLHAESNVETEPGSNLKAVMVLQGNPVYTRVLSDLQEFPNRSEVGFPMSLHILVFDPARLAAEQMPAHVFVAESGALELDALDIDADVLSGSARHINFVEVEAAPIETDFAAVPDFSTTLSLFGTPTDVRLNTLAMPGACRTRVETFTFASIR